MALFSDCCQWLWRKQPLQLCVTIQAAGSIPVLGEYLGLVPTAQTGHHMIPVAQQRVCWWQILHSCSKVADCATTLTMLKKCRKPLKSMLPVCGSAIVSMTSCAAAASPPPPGASAVIMCCTSSLLSLPSPFVSRCLRDSKNAVVHGAGADGQGHVPSAMSEPHVLDTAVLQGDK
jgi:hypothetical protein